MFLMKSEKKCPMLLGYLFQLNLLQLKLLLLKWFGSFLLKFDMCLTEFEK